MSEQAKIAFLQEKIKEAKRNERGGTLIFIIGFFLAAMYFLLPAMFSLPSPPSIPFLLMGIPVAIWGGAQIAYYTWRYNILMEQLQHIATKIPACPKCGKQIWQGNYKFCPFCGTALEIK